MGTTRGTVSRRRLLEAGAALALVSQARAQAPGQRPARAEGVQVVNPRDRVPVSLIIDDSTCLVNLNRFAVPQFAEASGSPERYRQPWREWPVEIPDDFVRRFVDWCGERGVRGKYSVVPYPACVGRIDRVLPGWTGKELDASIELVRTRVTRDWDIHPEMVTHTHAVDLKTGHPHAERSPRFQENWEWTTGKSADELAAYMAYALQILKNVGLPCEGITTPGGFGNRVLPELSRATLDACRSVYGTEIPHYFRHLYSEGDRSVAPRVEYASGLGGPDPRCVVSIIGCTGDWTGGWDCSPEPEPDRFITPDLQRGRMVDIIRREEPACMVCHWTGIYFNGRELGFKAFQEVVRRLHARFDNLVWMKNSEIARYWAAKELTATSRTGDTVTLGAPFACPSFTLRIPTTRAAGLGGVRVVAGASQAELRPVPHGRLAPGTWTRLGDAALACFDLPRGTTSLSLL